MTPTVPFVPSLYFTSFVLYVQKVVSFSHFLYVHSHIRVSLRASESAAAHSGKPVMTILERDEMCGLRMDATLPGDGFLAL